MTLVEFCSGLPPGGGRNGGGSGYQIRFDPNETVGWALGPNERPDHGPNRQAVFSSFVAAIKTLSQYMLNLDPPGVDLYLDAVSTLFLIFFVLASVIGVLNILIAQARTGLRE